MPNSCRLMSAQYSFMMDVTGGVARAGTPVEVWTANSPPSPNQLWEFVPVTPGAPIAEGFIRSLLAPNLVVDVTGGSKATRGTRLEVWPQNNPTSANQIWFPLAAPATISLYIGSGEFTFTGSGWVAGTTVQVTSDFIFATGDIPGGPYGVTVAADGTFRDTIPANYFGSAGQLDIYAKDANSGQTASAYALNLGG